jgi:hypothetical protein
MYSKILEILENLGLKDEKIPLYHWYLPLLNLYWSEEGQETGIERLRKLAIGVKDSPNFIRELIRDKNWRPTVLGNAIVILLRAKEFQKDLIWRLENGSWVAPQIAVAIALLNDGLAENELNKIIESASKESNPKSIMSAYSSLKFLKSKSAEEFEKTELFEVLKEKDSWNNSIRIAEEQWNFWKDIKPIN